MNTIDSNGLLLQMRALAARAQGGINETSQPSGATNDVDFSRVLRNALDSVNETQQTAKSMATRFEMGDPKVDLSQVMISQQKANISFQAVSQVRNKLVSAYQEIMNMPI
jgi:flagellar hook-basal body complex protein FliE